MDRATEDRVAPPTHVVGIGASAGGLAALEEFFDAMPSDSGMAFVVVQHLSPDFKSLMSDLLSSHTRMPIHRVENGIPLEANAVYLIPPRQVMTTAGGRLFLEEKDSHQFVLPIDMFLESLATAMGRQAIGIILSGTGSDGSRGVKAIHEAGGLVLAQSPETAQFDGMPRAAANTGVCDYTVAPRDMPQLLIDYARDPDDLRGPEVGLRVILSEGEFAEIFAHLRRRYGLDFSKYKPATVGRRIARRVEFRRVQEVSQYVELLEKEPEELDELYRDLLIGVTELFRDPDTFGFLERQVVPRLFEEASADGLRLWVAGCATGEEAYSLGILLHEHAESIGYTGKITIFATDVHRRSLETASAGLYPAAVLRSVSPERRQRYFVPDVANQVRVHPDLRKLVIFSAHNLLNDPPFTKMDLVSCRNLLIYFLPEAQERVLGTFTFALRQHGILLLGSSEGLGRFDDDFATLSGPSKVFAKRRDVRLPMELREFRGGARGGPGRGTATRTTVVLDRQLVHDYDQILARFIPSGVLLNERFHVLHHFGDVGRFLRPPSGRAESEFSQMVLPELRLAVSVALQRASSTQERFVAANVAAGRNPDAPRIDVCVECLPGEKAGPTHYLLTFVAARPLEVPAARPDDASLDLDTGLSPALSAHITDLEHELGSTRESLQATVEELQTSNEELQATNEELLASNEELQSTNEELHSLTEELYTVNAEFERKNNELHALNREHDHLLESLTTGIVFVDETLAIRKFNRASAVALNLLPRDIGRPIDHLAYHLTDQQHMLASIRTVLATGEPLASELQATDGVWYMQRIVPFIDERGAVKGVLITATDVTLIKNEQAKLKALFDVLPMGVTIVDADARVLEVNREAARLLEQDLEQLRRGEYRSRKYLRGDGSPMAPDELPSARVRRTRAAVRDLDIGLVLSDQDIRWISASAAPLPDGGVVSVMRDTTAQRRAEEGLRRWAEIFRHVAWGIAVGFGDDGTLDLLNPAFARMHGYAVEELAGLPVAHVFAPDEHEAMKAAMARVDETGHHGWEAMHVRKDGSRFPAAVDAVMVRDFAGAPLYRIMSVMDISERRKAQDEVKESERLLVRAQKLEALGTLAGGVAHDFNNILVAIRGSAALAADEVSAEHPVHSLLTEIEQAGKRATGLVTQILSFARPEEPSRAPVDLRALVDEAIRFLRAAIPARIELRTHYSENLPRAVVDANQVHQVVVNVVTNGFHAIGDGAGSVAIQLDEVTMSADDAGDVAPGPYVRVAVSDDGCGMDPQTLAKCCDPFFTTKAPGKGTGLGLSIVHGIMKSHRGALRIRSELGQGTVITLLFPVALPAHEAAAPSQRSIARQKHAACRVIVVDDDPAVGRLTKRYLVREGYAVTLEVDPVEAITRFEEAPGAFDAIITDLSMPRMSGFELVRRARLVRPEIPVIVTTGYLGVEDEETARRLEVNGIIRKPETLDQLVPMLEQVVAAPTATRASGPVGT